MTPGDGNLLDALERELRRISGVTVDREAWQWDQVPDHLKITFRVIDDRQKTLAEGKSLDALKHRLKANVQQTLSAVADDGLEQRGSAFVEFRQFTPALRAEKGRLFPESLSGAGG